MCWESDTGVTARLVGLGTGERTGKGFSSIRAKLQVIINQRKVTFVVKHNFCTEL